MKINKIAALGMIALLGGTSLAVAQNSSPNSGTTSETPERGAGMHGVGPSGEGRSANQPGSSMEPNSAATPGTGTQGTPGNMPAGTTR
jgi:hypothetical protein